MQKSAQPGNHCWHEPFDVWPVARAFVTRLAERAQAAWCNRGIIPHNGKPPAKNTGACGSGLKSQQNANTYYCTYIIKQALQETCWHFSSCTGNIDSPLIILSEISSRQNIFFLHSYFHSHRPSTPTDYSSEASIL